MPAATTKADLLAITRRDYGKLEKVVENIGDADALKVRDEETAIKDIIGHRAHWIDLFLGWMADGQAGREVHIPAKGYKWNQLKAYNAKVRADQSGLGWDEAKAMLADRHGKLVALIEDMDDTALYGQPMAGQEKWTAGRFAEASGASHYRSAAKVIRGWMK